MNKLPILAFALAPFVAMASPTDSDKRQAHDKSQKQGQMQSQAKVDKQKLQQATPVTALLDEEVFSQQDEEIGNVEDVVISQDGKVKNFIVDADLQNMNVSDSGQQDETESEWQQAEGTAERTADRAQTSLPEQGEMSVQPRDVKYDSKEGRVTISTEKLQAAQTDTSESGASDELRLSDVVGMEVNLQDDDSFGRVEDVMLSQDNSEVVALVVDNWDGLEKHRRALPIEQAQFNSEEEDITMSLSVADVEPLPDFNLDNYTDEGWDLANWID